MNSPQVNTNIYSMGILLPLFIAIKHVIKEIEKKKEQIEYN